MLIERNEFRIKFGKMKEAKAIWMEICQAIKSDKDIRCRMLTDITGPAYTLVVETELRDFIHIGLNTYKWMINKQITELYGQFTELCDGSNRTLYHVEYSV